MTRRLEPLTDGWTAVLNQTQGQVLHHDETTSLKIAADKVKESLMEVIRWYE